MSLVLQDLYIIEFVQKCIKVFLTWNISLKVKNSLCKEKSRELKRSQFFGT